jgi:hypothetical protein
MMMLPRKRMKENIPKPTSPVSAPAQARRPADTAYHGHRPFHERIGHHRGHDSTNQRPRQDVVADAITGNRADVPADQRHVQCDQDLEHRPAIEQVHAAQEHQQQRGPQTHLLGPAQKIRLTGKAGHGVEARLRRGNSRKDEGIHDSYL